MIQMCSFNITNLKPAIKCMSNSLHKIEDLTYLIAVLDGYISKQ